MVETSSGDEQVNHPLLPRRLTDVDAPWLTSELGKRYPGIVVEEMTELECKNSHTTKLRVAVRYNAVGVAAGLPDTLCLKANWSGIRTGQICEREARFYNMVAASPQLAAQVPTSYHAAWDSDGRGNGLVVMDDLALRPGKFGASTDHLGVDGVAAGLESLAAIHSSMWGSELLDQSWVPRSFATENDTEQVSQYWNFILFNLADPAYADSAPAWVFERPELMHWLLDELCAYEQEFPQPHTVVHGDAHQGNTFRKGDEDRSHVDPASWLWIDWQLVRRGSPWRDVSYFLVGSLTVEERRANERELLELYRKALVAGGADYVSSANGAWQHYIRYPAYGSQAWLGNINQWGQSNGAEIVKRHFAAVEDHNIVGVLTKGKQPRRPFVKGEGAYRLPPGLEHR